MWVSEVLVMYNFTRCLWLWQLLACALDSVFEVLDCADDVFALGSTSNIVATELASLSWAKTRRKVLQFLHFIYYVLMLDTSYL